MREGCRLAATFFNSYKLKAILDFYHVIANNVAFQVRYIHVVGKGLAGFHDGIM